MVLRPVVMLLIGVDLLGKIYCLLFLMFLIKQNLNLIRLKY